MQGLGEAALPETGRNETETSGSDGGALEMAGSGPEADVGGFRERRSFLQR